MILTVILILIGIGFLIAGAFSENNSVLYFGLGSVFIVLGLVYFMFQIFSKRKMCREINFETLSKIPCEKLEGIHTNCFDVFRRNADLKAHYDAMRMACQLNEQSLQDALTVLGMDPAYLTISEALEQYRKVTVSDLEFMSKQWKCANLQEAAARLKDAVDAVIMTIYKNKKTGERTYRHELGAIHEGILANI